MPGVRTRRVVAKPKAPPERLGAFSDGGFAVIITIMELDLRQPPQATLAALLRLWSAGLSYVVSYLFIAIVWVNHHHLLQFAEHATPRLIWVNFAHLFMVSLVPFSTAWVSDNRLAAVPVSVYAAVFVLVNLAYCAFVWEVRVQVGVEETSARMWRTALMRSFLTLGMFVIAMLLSLKFPLWGFGSICSVLLVYLRPEALWDRT